MESSCVHLNRQRRRDECPSDIRKTKLPGELLYPFNANVTILYRNRKYRFRRGKRKNSADGDIADFSPATINTGGVEGYDDATPCRHR